MKAFDTANASNEDVKQHIYAVISEVTGLEAGDIEPSLSIAEDIAPNSIDRVTLFMALEDEFGGSIEESEVAALETLEELTQFVIGKVEAVRRAG